MKLDRRIQFRRAASQDDGLSTVAVWFGNERDNHGDPVWASRHDVSDGERARAGAVEASLMTRFRIRWSTFARDITPADRLVCEGQIFEITGIKQVDRQRWLELSCTLRAD